MRGSVTKILKTVSRLNSNSILIGKSRTIIVHLRTETGRRPGVSPCV